MICSPTPKAFLCAMETLELKLKEVWTRRSTLNVLLNWSFGGSVVAKTVRMMDSSSKLELPQSCNGPNFYMEECNHLWYLEKVLLIWKGAEWILYVVRNSTGKIQHSYVEDLDAYMRRFVDKSWNACANICIKGNPTAGVSTAWRCRAPFCQ